ncbi:MAG: type II toxin-antitoxin system Phd/YefM family antitoxin [Patescibacteria group bacterium]
MTDISISQLKTNPAAVIAQAADYPVAVENRNKVQAYLIGKELYEKLMTFIEDYLDAATVKKTDFSQGRDFEKVARELGI